MNGDALVLDALIDAIVSGETVAPERFGSLGAREDARRLAHDLSVIATIAGLSRGSAPLTEGPGPARIGRFELGSPLGAGGMGAVWEARDTTLERAVAIKFLHPHLAGDAQYRERFLREGRAVARLHHRGICAIYEVGELPEALSLIQRGQTLELAAGTPYAAIELVRGVTLRERLRSAGRISDREILHIATEAAEALAAAHDLGIVHRDIKPANIMLGTDGRVVLLDFGLAGIEASRDVTTPSSGGGPQGDSRLTMAGDIVGTIAYMSPEQARGDKIDPRTDVFSLGLVIWEMLTGRAVDTESSAGVKNAIEERATRTKFIPEKPPLPKTWRRVLHRCVAANAGDRFPSARQLHAELRARTRSTRWAVAWPLAGGLALATVGAGAWFVATRDRPAIKPEPIQKQLTSNPPETAVNCAAISPDGTLLAFADPTGTYLRDVKTGATRRILAARTLDVLGTTWFPDGTRLAVTALSPSRQGLSAWTVSVEGGTPRKLRDDALVASISPDGSQLLFYNYLKNSPGTHNGVWIMGPDGEDARQVLPPPEGNKAYRSVAWAPDGKRLMFVLPNGSGGSRGAVLEISDLTGAPPKVVFSDPNLIPKACTGAGTWLADDRIVFTLNEPRPNEASANLWALRIDPTTSVATGAPERLTSLADTCISDTQTTKNRSQLSFLKQHRQLDVYVGELRDGGKRLEDVRRFTLDDRNDRASGWSRDGRAIYFDSDRHGSSDIFTQPVASGDAEAVLQGPNGETGATLSPDGAFLLYMTKPADLASAPNRLMRVPVGGGTSELVAEMNADESYACPTSSAGSCILSDSPDKKSTFYLLDAISGKGREIGRLPSEVHAWALSPDGARIAFIDDAPGNAGRAMRFGSMRVDDGTVDELHVPGVPLPQDLAWSADGRSLFVIELVAKGESPGWRVLHVDRDGHVTELRRSNFLWQWLSNPMPSPDGKYLAFGQLEFQSNVWSLTGF